MSSLVNYGAFIKNTVILLVGVQLSFHLAACIQCYSCKGSGRNEIEANIQCLETAYLENCDDFYQYYNEVEDSKVLSYEYYYYDEAGEVKGRSRTENDQYELTQLEGATAATGGDADDTFRYNDQLEAGGDQYYYDDEYYYEDEPARYRRDLPGDVEMTDVIEEAIAQARLNRRKRQARTKKKVKKESMKTDDEENQVEEDIEYVYEYEEVYVDELPGDNTTTTIAPTTTDDMTTEAADFGPSPTMPREPEHYCYSETRNNDWESYTVEKGCKKISYCENNLENLPSWGNPWNFCCDRARCNAKLVKDKPQRIFGMGCRRTDDCIQGASTRPVCPHMFQSCPKISSNMIKMDCRIKAKTMASLKNAARFQHMFTEKKCYCAKGYFPRGPICTSGYSLTQASIILTLAVQFVVLTLHL